MGTVTPGATQTISPVVFDYTWFQNRYPDLARWVSPEMGQFYFDMATLYCDNSVGSPNPPAWVLSYGYVGQYASGSVIADVPTRQILLGLLTAHVAGLNANLNGQAASTLVGRISNATEGSVSVSVDYPQTNPDAAWFNQTRWGAAFWQATTRFRQARYYPGPQPFRQNLYGLRGRGYSGVTGDEFGGGF